MDRLTLLTVHAHPDDEASKGPATVAKYHAEGVHTVLVSCTGGEEGDILNPAMERPGVKERIAAIRREELDRAAALIGYDEVVRLGYRDSGMPGTDANHNPESFAQAPIEEAVGRLVAVVRRTRPQVIITYARDHAEYPHPDHIRVNQVSELGFDAAGDPDRYPDAGPAWQPLKLCYVAWSSRRMQATHEKFLELGMESPFSEERWARVQEAVEREAADPAPRLVIDVRGFTRVRREALLAHRTQVDPTSRAWFGLPPEVSDDLYPYDEYIVARDLTGGEGPSDDLFGGVRVGVAK